MAELPQRPASHLTTSATPARRTTAPLRIAIVVLTLSLFGCDHATKMAAEASLSHERGVSVVAGLLELRLVRNDDVAFSMLHSLDIPRTPAVLLAAASLAILGVVAMWIASRKRASRAQHVGFALLLAGALGNVVDRALRGYVVDFIHLTRWPVFNVADISVVAGMILLGLCALRPSASPPAPTAAAAPEPPS